MTKELGEAAYRTYCRDRLLVSESADKVNAESSVKDEPETKKGKKPTTLFIK